MASSSIAGDSVYDFWEAVTCAKCHLRFVPDGGGPPLAPFWITECGHILCNNHLSEFSGNFDPMGLLRFQTTSKMQTKVVRTAGTNQSTWHHYSERSVKMCEPCGFSFGFRLVQMEPPISDWFRSLPYAIDSLANSVKVFG